MSSLYEQYQISSHIYHIYNGQYKTIILIRRKRTEQPLFLAKDVTEWIERTNPTVMLAKVDKEVKILMLNNVYNQISTHGGVRKEQWFLTEDGLYEVLMQSRKPIAKAFKKEVKDIYKQTITTGSYILIGVCESFSVYMFDKGLL